MPLSDIADVPKSGKQKLSDILSEDVNVTGTKNDPYSWAVQQATQQYPQLSKYDMKLTYNPRREGYSETFPPKGERANPYPGHWTVEMGESPYYYHPKSWPGLVGLEGLHAAQAEDPHYRSMTDKLGKLLMENPQQVKQLQGVYQRDIKQFGEQRRGFEKDYMPNVLVPEVIRDRMFGNLFHHEEGAPVGGWNEYNLTPEERKQVDQIDAYMRGR